METRFTQIRKAFRTMDEDKTGTVSRDELKQVLMDMNLAITSDVVSALIDIADVDGDGDTNPSCLTPASLPHPCHPLWLRLPDHATPP